MFCRLLLLAVLSNHCAVLKADDQLLHVHIIWRDGDHIPERVCVNDKNKWVGQPGALTTKGMRQQMQLGQYIFAKYAQQLQFIHPRYEPKEIYIRAVDVNRTIASATSSAVGMYYNRSRHIPGRDFPIGAGWPSGFVPFPVHMLQSSNDHVCNPDASCPRQIALLEIMKNSSEFQEFLNREQSAIRSIASKCGDSALDLIYSEYIDDANRIEKSQGRTPLLSDAEQVVIREALNFKNGFVSTSVTQNLTVIRAGPLFSEIVDHMSLKISCIQDSSQPFCKWMNEHKLYMYSLTQTGVDVLLGALAPATPTTSGVDSFVLFVELYSSENGPIVKLSYKSNDSSNEVNITSSIKACKGFASCSFETFRKYAADYRIPNIDQVCGASASESSKDRRSPPAVRNHFRNGRVTKPTNGSELVFLQIIWRHGDRNPKDVCKTDRNNDSTWWLGFDQLTQLGMEQHRLLGSMVYDEYVTRQKFLSAIYNPNEMYVRSADLNRTLISAISNLVGMYYSRGNQSDAFPIDAGWPAGFVPIPIHSVDDATDYIADPHVVCPRKSDLVGISLRTPEIQSVVIDNADFMKHLSDLCNKSLDLLGLATPVDTQQIENIYNRSTVYGPEDFSRMNALTNIGENVTYGLINTTSYGGYNLKVELATLSGGSLLFDMIYHIDLKVHCLEKENAASAACAWMGPLKYYAYSARGETLDAFLAALEAKEVFPNGIPDYTSAIVLELWRGSSGDYEVTIKFRNGPTATEMIDITESVDGCQSTGRCSLQQFKSRSQQFNPGVVEEMCQKRAPFNETGQHINRAAPLYPHFSILLSTVCVLTTVLHRWS